MIRYVLHPGYVNSKKDGQEHFISAGKLADLYRVSLSDCVVDTENNRRGFTKDAWENLKHLYPRYDGNYSKPTAVDRINKEETK